MTLDTAAAVVICRRRPGTAGQAGSGTEWESQTNSVPWSIIADRLTARFRPQFAPDAEVDAFVDESRRTVTQKDVNAADVGAACAEDSRRCPQLALVVFGRFEIGRPTRAVRPGLIPLAEEPGKSTSFVADIASDRGSRTNETGCIAAGIAGVAFDEGKADAAFRNHHRIR